MGDIAIRVEGLGKRYRIGEKLPYKALRDSIAGIFRSPLRFFKQREEREDNYIWALRDVSFEIKHGEVVGIIGRNGAGKSTLLKILSRITEPTEGYGEIHGRVGSLLEVGTGFHPELTGRENIYLNGAILGMRKKEIDHKFDEIVAFAEVDRFIDTPVKFYSSGMYVRLAFSVAAHLEPEILLVDEVLAVGDAAFQKKCLGKMGDVAKEGRTVLFVSHNMAVIRHLCKRCVLLGEGRIAVVGPTDRVISAYLLQGQQRSGLVQVNAGNPDTAFIHKVGVINASGEFAHSVEVDKDFFIWIECEIKRKLEQSQIAIAIQSVTDSAVAFVTTHTDARPIKDMTLLPGKYRAKVRIPGNFLNVGTYTANVRIIGRVEGATRSSHATAFNVLTFTVEETGSIASKLMDGRRGLVTPVLEWTFE